MNAEKFSKKHPEVISELENKNPERKKTSTSGRLILPTS